MLYRLYIPPHAGGAAVWHHWQLCAPTGLWSGKAAGTWCGALVTTPPALVACRTWFITLHEPTAHTCMVQQTILQTTHGNCAVGNQVGTHVEPPPNCVWCPSSSFCACFLFPSALWCGPNLYCPTGATLHGHGLAGCAAAIGALHGQDSATVQWGPAAESSTAPGSPQATRGDGGCCRAAPAATQRSCMWQAGPRVAAAAG